MFRTQRSHVFPVTVSSDFLVCGCRPALVTAATILIGRFVLFPFFFCLRRHRRPVLCPRPGPRRFLVRPVSLSSFRGRPSPDPRAAVSSQYLIKLC